MAFRTATDVTLTTVDAQEPQTVDSYPVALPQGVDSTIVLTFADTNVYVESVELGLTNADVISVTAIDENQTEVCMSKKYLDKCTVNHVLYISQVSSAHF